MHMAPAGRSAAAGGREAGFTVPPQRVSHCAIEVEAPWRALQCLTPDAMQLADPHWSLPRYPSAVWEAGAAAAKEGEIAALKLLSLDVQMATRDGAERYPTCATQMLLFCLVLALAPPYPMRVHCIGRPGADD